MDAAFKYVGGFENRLQALELQMRAVTVGQASQLDTTLPERPDVGRGRGLVPQGDVVDRSPGIGLRRGAPLGRGWGGPAVTPRPVSPGASQH